MDIYFAENSGQDAKYICTKKREYIRSQIMSSSNKIFIKNFLMDLEKIPYFDLNLFYHNITTLRYRIGNSPFNPLTERNLIGYYVVKNNFIALRKDFQYDDSSHEELHMASAYNPDHEDLPLHDLDCQNLNFCGLCQDFGKYTIGRDANEGFSEILVKRHFTSQESFCYPRQQIVAQLIEEIVSSPLMYEAYSTANLPLIIHELEKYEHLNRIINVLMLNSNNDKNFIIVRKFLNDVLVKKYKELYHDHKISYDELICKLSDLSQILESKDIAKQYHGKFNTGTIRDINFYNLKTYGDSNAILALTKPAICQKGQK